MDPRISGPGALWTALFIIMVVVNEVEKVDSQFTKG